MQLHMNLTESNIITARTVIVVLGTYVCEEIKQDKGGEELWIKNMTTY